MLTQWVIRYAIIGGSITYSYFETEEEALEYWDQLADSPMDGEQVLIKEERHRVRRVPIAKVKTS